MCVCGVCTVDTTWAQPPIPHFPVISDSNDADLPKIDNDAAMKQIMQMSPLELQEAQREITAMFKPKNLEFLQKMAAKKFGNMAMQETKDNNLEIKESALKSIGSDQNANIQVIISSRQHSE